MALPLVPILLGAGAGLQAYGQIRQGKAAREAAEQNAVIAEQTAKEIEQQGQYQVEQVRKEAKQVVGSMQANYGASGVTLEGSPMDWMAASIEAAENDVSMIRRNSSQQARFTRMGGQMQLKQGQNYATNSMFAAGGSILGGIGSVYGKSASSQALGLE